MSKQSLGLKKPAAVARPKFDSCPYRLYLVNLAPTGRRAMAILLNKCTVILGHDGPTDEFDWTSLTLEKVHLIKTTLVEMKYSVNTINMTIAALRRGVTKTAFNLGKMFTDDMLRVGAIKSMKGRTSSRKGRCLSQSEIRKLIAACEQYPSRAKQLRDKALLLVSIGAGLRCAEICSLQMTDVYRKNDWS